MHPNNGKILSITNFVWDFHADIFEEEWEAK